MLPWPPSVNQAFLALAPHATVAGPLCRAVADGHFCGVTRLRDICTAAGLAEVRSGAVEAALEIGTASNLFVHCGGLEWRPAAADFAELATALEAVALYRERVHVDVDAVEVVLTPPGNPSRLGEALRTHGWVEAELEHTEAILRHLAMQATERFAVLSPFLDSGGMDSLIALFKATKSSVQRVLVTRCVDGVMPVPLQTAYPVLTALGVVVHNYWLPRHGGYETFHAKALIADSQFAYIGSANMTQASMSLSMELGTFLRGNSVKTLARIVDTILTIAPRLG